MPTPEIIGTSGTNYSFGIDDNTTIPFVEMESQELSHERTKHEVKDKKNNTIVVAFSGDAKAYSINGVLKGTEPKPGDILDFQPVGESSTVKTVIQDDVKISESSGDWKKVSFTTIYYPSMTHA